MPSSYVSTLHMLSSYVSTLHMLSSYVSTPHMPSSHVKYTTYAIKPCQVHHIIMPSSHVKYIALQIVTSLKGDQRQKKHYEHYQKEWTKNRYTTVCPLVFTQLEKKRKALELQKRRAWVLPLPALQCAPVMSSTSSAGTAKVKSIIRRKSNLWI